LNIKKIAAAMSGLAAIGLALASPQAAAASSAKALLRDKCLSCHSETGADLGRISQQRKTPEGWLMTVGRMQVAHGLKVTNKERHVLVKYLADTQGLAPSETEGGRYALERRMNTQESFDSELFTEMCARCHSGARVLLQRRAAKEWEHLVHFHLGQFVTAEYSAMGRDRDWFGIALEKMVPELARTLPLDSEAWKRWNERSPQKASGEWSTSGYLTGRGGFSGLMKVAAGKDKDSYSLVFEGRWDDGRPLKGNGQALVYTGYEWRGDLEFDGMSMRQVFAIEGGVMRGRMYLRGRDDVGGDVLASLQRADNQRVLAVHPPYLKAGETAELRIVGSGLQGEVTMPTGVTVLETVKRSASEVILRVKVDAEASGVHSVAVGKASGGSIALYDSIAAVKVSPAFAVARIGGNGTPLAKVGARFDAEGWAAGPDGKVGTKDDFRIGYIPAKWTVEPFDQVAVRDEDVRFAGTMDEVTGVFEPGDAGPNPARRMSANNVGNLKVVAEIGQNGKRLRGEGRLVVTAPRWNNPPVP